MPNSFDLDKGAHFHKCDFQIHTPRDTNWQGEFSVILSDSERNAFAEALVFCCRRKGINAIAITDHHDLCLWRFVWNVAQKEVNTDSLHYNQHERLIVFPGVELTLSTPPCQVLAIFDPSLSNEALFHIWGALGIIPIPSTEARYKTVIDLTTDKDLKSITKALSTLIINPEEADPQKRHYLAGHFILLPHVRENGHQTITRRGFEQAYAEMPCVGGYIEGNFYCNLTQGNKDKLEGRSKEWGSKAIGVFQTSDNREARSVEENGKTYYEFPNIGKWPTWVKWTEPTTEALRQACLARTSRISYLEPILPSLRILGIEILDCLFLGPIKLAFNPQYNTFIGGRGTGKSSLFEYLRWALCDNPISLGNEHEGKFDLPNYQKRRKALIEETLKPRNAAVVVYYEKFGAIYKIKRSSTDQLERVFVTSPDGSNDEMTGEQVRRDFPIIAYAQKQLSNVATLPDEIHRLVTDPIRNDISEMNRKLLEEILPLLKSKRQKEIRKNSLEAQVNEMEQLIKAKREQVDSLKNNLENLSEQDQKIIDLHEPLTHEIEYLNEVDLNFNNIRDALNIAKTAINNVNISEVPVNLPNEESLKTIELTFRVFQSAVISDFDKIIKDNNELSNLGPEIVQIISEIKGNYLQHQSDYDSCIGRTAKNAQQLENIKKLNNEIEILNAKIIHINAELRQLLIEPTIEKNPWNMWLKLHDDRSNLIKSQCKKVEEQAQETFRAILHPFADQVTIQKSISQIIDQCRNIREKDEKVCRLSLAIANSENPLLKWQELVNEFDSMMKSKGGALPNLLLLQSAEFTTANMESIRDGLTQDFIENIRYTILHDRIDFEFAFGTNPDGSKNFIPFEKASPGQQATSLLRTLLGKNGPPLLIDQPEEDLDNEQIREISDHICETKNNRQLLFISHNANVVVNGDAELVVCFGYRNPNNPSSGNIVEQGSIDYEPIKRRITAVMEGGKEAFELRRQKYGF